MSFQYDQYLTQHRSNVKRGFDWIAENLPELLVDGFDYGWQIEFAHDKSKDEQDEYEAYDAYFYGGNRSYAVMQNYQKAWLLHLHRNPHHWQYWILINDDLKESSKVFLEDEMYGSNGGICRASAASQQTGSWLWRQNRTLGRDGRCVYLPKLPGVHF